MLIAKTHTTRRCRLCKSNLYSGAGYYVINTSKGKYVCEHCVNLMFWYLVLCLFENKCEIIANYT